MSTFHLTPAPDGVPASILTIHDRINLSNTDELEAIVRQGYDAGMRNLVLDLSETPSITSSGLRSIIIIYRLLANAGNPPADEAAPPKAQPVEPAQPAKPVQAAGTPARLEHLKLAGVRPEVLRILDLAGMTRFLDLYDDVDGALRAFQAPR